MLSDEVENVISYHKTYQQLQCARSLKSMYTKTSVARSLIPQIRIQIQVTKAHYSKPPQVVLFFINLALSDPKTRPWELHNLVVPIKKKADAHIFQPATNGLGFCSKPMMFDVWVYLGTNINTTHRCWLNLTTRVTVKIENQGKNLF